MSLKKNLLLSICFILVLYLYITVQSAYFVPKAAPIDLLPLLSEKQLTDEEYLLIYEQTGIAKPLYEELKTMPNFTEKMLRFQADYLKKRKVKWVYLPPITFEERLANNEGTFTPGFEIGPYHNGYILFTKAAHSLGWHHGHAGIVIDEKHGKTLEALSIGAGCKEQNISKWQYYPTFKMMRLKNASLEELNQIALYSKDNLIHATYNLLSHKHSDLSLAPTETQCALLIWQAFFHFGYNLDSQGHFFVTPKSLASSPLLEVLQNYGFNPYKAW